MGKSSEFTSIQEILKKILEQNNNLPDIELLQLKKAWKNIVGDPVCTYTEPFRITNNVLIVTCNHQGWINTLQLLKNEILEKIKAELENKTKITDIKFVFKSRYHR